MLEHADRDDAVELLRHLAIVLDAEFDRAGQIFFGGAFSRALDLLARQRHAGDVGAAEFGEVERKPAPAAADVEHAMALADQELRGKVPLLGELRVVERLVGRLEIGAGVLPVRIEEKRIQPAVEIVMMRDVALCARGAVELLQPAVEVADDPLRPRPARRHAVRRLAEHECEEIGDRAFLYAQRTVHVGFAEPKFRIEQYAALGGSGHEADRDRPAGAVAEGANGTARRRDPEGSAAHEPPEQQIQQPVHRPHPPSSLEPGSVV